MLYSGSELVTNHDTNIDTDGNYAMGNTQRYNSPQQDLPTRDFNFLPTSTLSLIYVMKLDELLGSHQDRRLVDFVVKAFKDGCRIGFTATTYVTAH